MFKPILASAPKLYIGNFGMNVNMNIYWRQGNVVTSAHVVFLSYSILWENAYIVCLIHSTDE